MAIPPSEVLATVMHFRYTCQGAGVLRQKNKQVRSPMTESAKDKAAKVAQDAASKAKAAAAAATPTSAKDAAEKAKSAAYTVVGLGVMGFGKAQAGARHVVEVVKAKDLTEHVATLKEQANKAAKVTSETAAKADQQIETVITKAEERLAPVTEKLPDQARNLVTKAQETGRDTRAKVRAKVFPS